VNIGAAHAAFGAVGMLVALGMYGAAGWIGARYDADENPDPYPRRDPAEVDTEPWPAPR
jgi:hypothetical protein